MNTESYLIATLLTFPESFLDVAEFLRAEDFDNQEYAEIYSSMARLSAKSIHFDAITVKSEMDAAHAVQVMEKYGVTVDRIAPAGQNGLVGDLGDLHNPGSARVQRINHADQA